MLTAHAQQNKTENKQVSVGRWPLCKGTNSLLGEHRLFVWARNFSLNTLNKGEGVTLELATDGLHGNAAAEVELLQNRGIAADVAVFARGTREVLDASLQVSSAGGPLAASFCLGAALSDVEACDCVG